MSLLLAILAAGAVADLPPVCRVLTVEKRAGEPVFADELAPQACPAELPSAALRYDRNRRLVVAARDLAAGANLGLVSAMPRPAVRAGDEVMIEARIGHVVVSRPAIALQTVRRGERFFVRSPDGKIFVAPAIAAQAEEIQR